MKDSTLCLPLRDGGVLLGMKKRGFGQGRWNGMGGKPHDGETVEAATVRELEEEIGIRAEERGLERCATIDFSFEHRPEWDQRVHVFFVREWEGEPAESEEMRPQWFAHADIPFDEMWPDDRYWLPLVLEGKVVRASFRFGDDGNTITSKEVVEVD